METKSKICPRCNEKNNPALTACWKCGYDFTTHEPSDPSPESQAVLRVNASAINASEILLKIHRGSINRLLNVCISIFTIIVGSFFIYTTSLTKDCLGWWIGMILFFAGLIASFLCVKNYSKPVIQVTRKGMFLDILLFGFGKQLFLPWKNVKNIFEGTTEDFQRLSVKQMPLFTIKKYLGIELEKDRVKTFPNAVKNINYGQGWDLVPTMFFFKSIDISTDVAIKELLTIKNG